MWKKSTYKFIFWSIILLFWILTVLRLSIIGQGIDDSFRFIFGWTKYPIYFLIIAIFIKKIGWLQFFDFKKIKKRTFLKIGWLIFNFYWTLGLIGGVIWNVQENNFSNYSGYLLTELLPDFVENWRTSSVYTYKLTSVKDFFNYHYYFSQTLDSGGIWGIIIASISCYLSIFGALIINLFNWFLWSSYTIHNSVWFYFLSYDRRDRIRWDNLNENKKYQIQTNIIDEIEDQDITIELQTAKKIQMQDEEKNHLTLNLINQKHQQSLATKQQESVKKVEINLADAYETETEDNWQVSKKDKQFLDWIEATETKEISEKNNQDHQNPAEGDDDQSLPNLELFTDLNKQEEKNKTIINQTKAKTNADKIKQIFQEYTVKAKITNWCVGSKVTRYEISLEIGTKVQRILELEKELKLILGEERLRLEAPIPGKSAVGIEVPNPCSTIVGWKEVAKTLPNNKNKLILGIGKDLLGKIEQIELDKLPHLLIAGSTGGGKTVCLLVIICSLIYKQSPNNLKLLLIDPKRVELNIFEKIPHLLMPVITNNQLVPAALDKIIIEIEKRFNLFATEQVTNITEFNAKKTKEKRIPFIVLIIDELADLILTHQKNIESKIIKIGQIGRAAGIFMIVATQRPSADIITSLIKTNIPGRIAFSVPTYNDSRTILNFSGAEKLMGKGDMLYVKSGQKPKRLQGAWIQREEINNLVNFWYEQNHTQYYWKEFMNLENEEKTKPHSSNLDLVLYEKIKEYVETLDQQISISLIQRQFNLGFNRAANIFDKLKSEGVIDSKNKKTNLSSNQTKNSVKQN